MVIKIDFGKFLNFAKQFSYWQIQEISAIIFSNSFFSLGKSQVAVCHTKLIVMPKY